MTTLNTLMGQIKEIEKSGDFTLLIELQTKITEILKLEERKVKQIKKNTQNEKKRQEVQKKSDIGFSTVTSLGLGNEVTFIFKNVENKGVIKRISHSTVLIEFDGISRQIKYDKIITS